METLALDQASAAAGVRSSHRNGSLRAGWRTSREYLEVLAVIGLVTVLGWFAPFSYRAWGHIYLLAVILMAARVGGYPALFAAVVSALAWNYVIVPPRLSFSVVHLEDELTLGTYFVAALIAGQLTATIRAQELRKAHGEQRALALFNLTRALAAATTLDDAVEAALRQADALFGARTALLVADDQGALSVHPASSHALSLGVRTLARWAAAARREIGRCTADFAEANALYVPLLRDKNLLGVFVIAPGARAALMSDERDFVSTFAAQIALMIERERLRDAGAQAKLMAESDRLRRTLLDSVSHELKTPLAVLRTAAEGVDTSDPSRRAALAGEILTAAHRLDRLVANLLNQTRLEAGAVRPQLAPCDVRDLIAAGRRMAQFSTGDRRIRIEVAPDVSLVSADAALMEHVLGNLLINAAIYSPPERPIDIAAGPAGDRAFISIADRGPGIPAELQRTLFEKFQRGKHAATGGVGLGLAIVRGFIAAQHGDVVVENRAGGGSVFTVFLPSSVHAEVPVE